MIQHLDCGQKQLCGKGLISPTGPLVSIAEGSQDRDSSRAGTWRQELKQGIAGWLAYFLDPCFVTFAGPPAHRGTTCNSLGLHTNHQLRTCLTGLPQVNLVGAFSQLVSLPDLTLTLASTGGKVFNGESRQG